jgi:hypothetical protein
MDACVAGLAALRSPRMFGSIVVKELARLIWTQLFDEPPHRGYTLTRRQGRVRPAQVGLDPSRIDDHASDPLWRAIDGSASRDHIHGRLGDPIGNRATGCDVDHRSLLRPLLLGHGLA